MIEIILYDIIILMYCVAIYKIHKVKLLLFLVFLK